MALLKFRHRTPPEDWTYLQRETQLWIKGENLSDLVEKVAQHRVYKGLTPTDKDVVQWEVERQICSGLDEKHCRAEPGETYRPIKDRVNTISLEKVVSATSALMELLGGGHELVSKEEAQRRATFCLGCKFNRQASSCTCTPFYKAIDALVPADRKISGLHVCGACGCSLQAKVLMPDDVIRKSLQNTDVIFPSADHCWQATFTAQPNGPDQKA